MENFRNFVFFFFWFFAGGGGGARPTFLHPGVPERAIARARRIQATTSFTAAADMAIRPTSVVRSLSSARMRARTGKAVMERDTPMKTRKGASETPLEIVPRRTKEVPIPRMKGKEIPATAIPRALEPVWRMERMSSSRPTRKRK